VATIKVQERIGVRRTVDVARRLGVESPLHENLSIALGTSDLTLLELTSAYGSLANQGTWVKPTAIRYVLDSQRKMLEENVPQGRQALPPDLAYVVTHMMQGTIERGTGQAAKALGRPAAAKTGPRTTTRTRGSSASRLISPRAYGWAMTGRGASGRTRRRACRVPIWTAFMKEVLHGSPVEDFPVPEGVVLVPGGSLGAGTCARPVMMAFIAGTEPRNNCGPGRGSPRPDQPGSPSAPPTEAGSGAAAPSAAGTTQPQGQ